MTQTIKVFLLGGGVVLSSLGHASSGIGDLSARLDLLEKRMEGWSPAGEAFATEQDVAEMGKRLSALEAKIMHLAGQIDAFLERSSPETQKSGQNLQQKQQAHDLPPLERKNQVSTSHQEDLQALEMPAHDLSTPASFPSDSLGEDSDLSAIMQDLSSKDALQVPEKHTSEAKEMGSVKTPVAKKKESGQKSKSAVLPQKSSQVIAQEIISSKNMSAQERGEKLVLLADALKREGKHPQLEKILMSKDFPQEKIKQYKK